MGELLGLFLGNPLFCITHGVKPRRADGWIEKRDQGVVVVHALQNVGIAVTNAERCLNVAPTVFHDSESQVVVDPVQIVPTNEPAASAFFIKLVVLDALCYLLSKIGFWVVFVLSLKKRFQQLTCRPPRLQWPGKTQRPHLGHFAGLQKWWGQLFLGEQRASQPLGLPKTPQFRARQLALWLAVARPLQWKQLF